MRIIIKTTNTTLTPSMAQYLTDKLSDIERFLVRVGSKGKSISGGRETLEARVELGRTTRHHRKGSIFLAEVNIDLGRKQLVRAEAQMPTLRLAIDEVKKELKNTILSWKERTRQGSRRGARKAKEMIRNSRR